MKRILALSFVVSILVFGCKKKDDGPTDQDAQTVYALTKTVADARSKFLELAPEAGGDPKLALIQTLNWVQQDGNVATAFHQDSTYLFIEMSSGLTSMLWINELDANGQSRFRGGGSGGMKALTANGGCTNVVENKDVLIYSPGEDQFHYDYLSQVPERLQNESIIENVDFLKNGQASIEKISTFSNYGLVLMETHGSPMSFLTGSIFSFNQPELPSDYIEFRDALLSEIGQEYVDHLLTGKLQVGGQVTYDPLDINWWSNNQQPFEGGNFELWATSKFLEDLPSLSNTIVYGNFCYSGWMTPTNEYPTPIGQAFFGKNPITYYAYKLPNGESKPADNLTCIHFEDSLTRRLIIDMDSTGVAHKQTNGSPFNFEWPTEDLQLVQVGEPDWCYGGCGSGELVDDRDGQVYQTVCVGNRIWMAENLNYNAPGSVCYANDEQNCDTYGRLYDHETALTACPEGWRLPFDSEWTLLISSLEGYTVAGGKLKATTHWAAPNTGATNESGWTGLPGGYYDAQFDQQFESLSVLGRWWAFQSDGDIGKGRYLINESDDAFSFNFNLFYTSNKLSCRCVKNE